MFCLPSENRPNKSDLQTSCFTIFISFSFGLVDWDTEAGKK